MAKNISCEHSKSGKEGKCYCHVMNRKWQRELKLYRQFMKNLDTKGKK